MEMLTIGKYKDGYIKATDYNESIHKKIYCPFCTKDLELACVQNRFFRAMTDEEGHDCGKKEPIYLYAEWIGRKIVEEISRPDGSMLITVDINKLDFFRKKQVNADLTNDMEQEDNIDNTKSYNRYKEYKEVFRDVVNTAVQMKRLIEKNSLDKLKKLTIKYKCGDKEFGIDDILKTVDQLNGKISGEYRFVLFKVENMKLSGGKLYINSYNTDGIKFTAALKYPSNENRLDIKKDDFVIAYGRLNYAYKYNRFYLNLMSDLSIDKMKRQSVESLFEGKTLEEFKMNNKSIKFKGNKLEESNASNELNKEESIKEKRIPYNKTDNSTNVKNIVRIDINRSRDNETNGIVIEINNRRAQKKQKPQKRCKRLSKGKRIVKSFINKLISIFTMKS
ncbi:hypothetical protein [Anaeromicrobium sediminis]|uniref:Uncharacterized protein n=1 Tax=Anaeromicrobium sediminis TaxID=1478221 RepID=A0A267MRC6_9FIRM|nr:hypothetical protein [Anaeromicrobium sediminis]PAB61290.1 hypothetical protein CCE28_02340 [Anaeromicrobium sediminis]